MKKTIKKIYKLIPFKKQLFIVWRAVWRPGERIYRHLTFNGAFKVKVGNSGFFKIKHFGYQVENEIFWVGLTGGWEKESMKLWLKLCSGAKVILDIGANTGVYALAARTVSPQAQVFAFEPVKRVYQKLKENIDLNNFEIKSFEKAVSDKNGTAIIYDSGLEHVYSVTVNKNLSEADTKVFEVPIETVTLDSFIREYDIKKIDLVKIDVETHEPEVLAGFSEFLPRYKPALLIEILNDDIGQQVNEIVKDLGYLYFNIDEKGSVRQVNKITKSDYYNYLLCNREKAAELGLVDLKVRVPA